MQERVALEAEGLGPGRWVSRGLCAQGAAPEKTADREEGRREERERGRRCSEETRLRRGSQATGPLPSGPETGEAAEVPG